MAKKNENIMIHEAPNQKMTGAIVVNDTPPQAEVQAAPVTQPVTTPATDPYAGYQQQMSDNYATTLADIRKRRQELESRYQPDIERQQKVMKIMALGKLLGAIGQLAGGGRGPVIKDKDPYQVNAWKQLQQLKNEQMYYGQKLDAEERAARQSMQQGLSRLNLEKAKAAHQEALLRDRYQYMAENDQKKFLAQKELENIRAQARIDLKNLGYEQALKLMEQRFKNSAALKQMGYNNSEALAYLRASLDADKRADALGITTVTMTSDDGKGNKVRTVKKSGSVTRPTQSGKGQKNIGNGW